MPIRAEIRKLIRVALLSSLAVSLLTTTPVFMLTRLPFGLYPWTLLFATLLTVAMWGLNILLYYFAGSRRWLRYSGSYLLCVGFAVGVFHGLLHAPGDVGVGGGQRGFYFHVILFFSVDTVLLIVQDLVVVRERKAAVELENARLRMRNAEAANLQLRQQIQPHFLFNSLSTLKSLIRHSPSGAEEYVLKLSGFLRSLLASQAASLVRLEEELSLCRDYLEMQRIRFGEALQYKIEAEGPGFLPVFALQGLIENAIKHNVLTPQRPLAIRLRREGAMIRVSNNLQLREGVEAGGTGLKNLRERYRGFGEGEVLVEESVNEFTVYISILEHENRDHRG